MDLIPALIVLFMFGIIIMLIWAPTRKKPEPPKLEVHPTPVNINLEALERRITDLPNKVLQSIQGSANVHKGVLGELIGYIELRAAYDRIIPIGNIVDFICIKFPTKEQEGSLDFVEVKAGGARLDKDQRRLQELIKEKKISFVTLRVTDSKVSNEDSS